MFDFIVNQQLQDHHFEQKTEWLIEGFIAKNLITLIYADGGNGKSWIAAAIAKFAATQMRVLYVDYDTGLRTLSSRGLKHKLIDVSQRLHYVHRGSATMRPAEFLAALEEHAVAQAYHNTLIILDSLRNFGDISNDTRAMQVMDQIMNLREAGATVLIISHANKDGRNYQGSNNIRNSIDNMYRLTKLDALASDMLRFMLCVEKERVEISDIAFDFELHNLKLHPIDLTLAQVTTEDKSFINEVKALLIKQPGINKAELLDALGYKPDHKQARDRLDHFEGIYWRTEKGQKNATLFFMLESDNTDNTDKTQ